MTIANKIKQYRDQHELTQAQFAEAGGLTREVIQSIENERNTNPTLDTLEGIARAMGISIDELVKE
jgi:transcriptional regulator with XRE-family HTH domain